jgi:hypothetical protein
MSSTIKTRAVFRDFCGDIADDVPVPTHKSKGERTHYRAVDLDDDAQEVFQKLKALAPTSTVFATWVFIHGPHGGEARRGGGRPVG